MSILKPTRSLHPGLERTQRTLEFDGIYPSLSLRDKETLLKLSGVLVPAPLPLYERKRSVAELMKDPGICGTLLPQEDFTRWFIELIFELLLPLNSNWISLDPETEMASPFNATIIFRLMIYLRSFGYPTHWISEVWTSFLGDEVTTTCRPPRTYSPGTSDLQKRVWNDKKHLTMRPFMDELTTLTAMFREVLPFPIPSSIVPRMESIHQYKISLASDAQLSAISRDHNLLLVLWNQQLLPLVCLSYLRTALDPSCGNSKQGTVLLVSKS